MVEINNRCENCMSIQVMVNVALTKLSTTKITTCHYCNHVKVETTNKILNSICLNLI